VRRLLLSLAGVLLGVAGLLAYQWVMPHLLMPDPAVPAPRELARHAARMRLAERTDAVFLGDSLTDFWRDVPDIQAECFGNLRITNLGTGEDSAANVLWRVREGEVSRLHPRAAMLLVGTNDARSRHTDRVAFAIGEIVRRLREPPDAPAVLVVGVLPRRPDDATMRTRIAKLNAMLAKLDNGDTVRFLDISGKFRNADGSIRRELMPEELHLSPEGYRVWGEAAGPVLREMLSRKSH
jgi:lysophospholipase L1-like esterase